jgi:hypothetical protein
MTERPKILRVEEAEAMLSSLYGQRVVILERAGGAFGGIPLHVTDAVPPDEAWLVQDGKISVRITNLSTDV